MFDRTLIGEGIGTSKSARRVPLHLHTPSPPTLPAPPHSQREEIIKRNATRRAAPRRVPTRPDAPRRAPTRPDAPRRAAPRPPVRPPARPPVRAPPFTRDRIKAVSKAYQRSIKLFDIVLMCAGQRTVISKTSPRCYIKNRV